MARGHQRADSDPVAGPVGRPCRRPGLSFIGIIPRDRGPSASARVPLLCRSPVIWPRLRSIADTNRAPRRLRAAPEPPCSFLPGERNTRLATIAPSQAPASSGMISLTLGGPIPGARLPRSITGHLPLRRHAGGEPPERRAVWRGDQHADHCAAEVAARAALAASHHVVLNTPRLARALLGPARRRRPRRAGGLKVIAISLVRGCAGCIRGLH